MTEIKKVLVIGSGDYAQKIKELLAKAGCDVSLSTVSNKASQVDLIIEAVPGDFQKKRSAFAGCVDTSPNTFFATTIPGGVTEVASGTGYEARVVGLNFLFNPFEDKCAVQIVRGLETSAEATNACKSLVEKAGAVAVAVEDVSGLVVDRVMASVINEAALMYDTKLASMEDINRIPILCLNWRVGPFEFADLIGIDNIVATLEEAAKDSTQYMPCRLLRRMVAAGHLGKKTGRGFFDYTKGA